MTNCIETKNLNYHFSKNDQVLKEINLSVPEGSIFGFLGPNGAGKTTTLKLLLGLLRHQEGQIHFFDKAFHENRIEILKNVGSLIESPSIYPQLTATENLRIWQKIYQCPKDKIEEILKIVDLSHTGKKKAGKFSLGMKQRLSIGIALLHDPKVLVLDEPTNGLDPSGILEIRKLLIRINAEKNTTIIISSHLLSEIEKLVTHVGIINKGQILFQGTMSELQLLQAKGSMVVLKTGKTDEAIQLFKEKGLEVSQDGDRLILPAIDQDEIASLNVAIIEKGIPLYQVALEKSDLESIFMDLTK